jgi:hypothetical protein
MIAPAGSSCTTRPERPRFDPLSHVNAQLLALADDGMREVGGDIDLLIDGDLSRNVFGLPSQSYVGPDGPVRMPVCPRCCANYRLGWGNAALDRRAAPVVLRMHRCTSGKR